MPEPDGMALETALTVVGILAAAFPVVGFGATAVTLENGDGPKTVDAIAQARRGGVRAGLTRHEPSAGSRPDFDLGASAGAGNAISSHGRPVASAEGDPDRPGVRHDDRRAARADDRRSRPR